MGVYMSMKVLKEYMTTELSEELRPIIGEDGDSDPFWLESNYGGIETLEYEYDTFREHDALEEFFSRHKIPVCIVYGGDYDYTAYTYYGDADGKARIIREDTTGCMFYPIGDLEAGLSQILAIKDDALRLERFTEYSTALLKEIKFEDSDDYLKKFSGKSRFKTELIHREEVDKALALFDEGKIDEETLTNLIATANADKERRLKEEKEVE